MATPQSFSINIPDEVLDDLRSRLKKARVVPNEIAAGEFDPNGAWACGTDRTTLNEYLEYWLEAYDWREQEAKLNKLHHFTLPVKGLGMHFIHELSDKADAIPLLLCHGWPGSIVEFIKVIPALSAAGFHVVAPSIPGFGWSEAPRDRGGNLDFMAEHMHELMQQLGYVQYVAQGGDWGSVITARCANLYPQHCVAYHSNMCVPLGLPTDLYAILKTMGGLIVSSEGRSIFKSTLDFLRYETAYQQIQGTKPQSLSYGLNDSPVGLLAWILEKFQSWADCGSGPPENSGLTKDEILTNVMVYWVTQTIASSCRIYYEVLPYSPHAKPMNMGYVAVPTGVLMTNDILCFPRFMLELYYNVKHWSVQKRGGHFFALEQPEAFIKEVVHFFKGVLDFEECKAKCPKPGQGRPLELGRLTMYSLLLFSGFSVVRRLRARI